MSPSERERRPDGAPVWIWLGAPFAIVGLQLGAKALGEDVYRRTMRGELGLVENATVLFLVLATIAALGAWRRRRLVAWRLFGPLALALALGCAFFAGEEVSWGQHWLGFEPPAEIAARNDQGEFNLHNDPFFEKLLDQAPRLGLTLAAVVLGIVGPLMGRHRRPRRFDAGPGGWIWPSIECLPAALLASTVSVPEKVFERVAGSVPAWLDISAGETKEFGLALFLMLYLRELSRSLRQVERGPAAA